MMSIATRLAAVLAAIALSAGSTAQSGQSMDAAEIAEALGGVTLDGIYHDGSFFTETYFDDGTIRYRDAVGADSGDWSVRNDLFCTFYETMQGSCFFVVREGDNCFTFFEPERGDDGEIVPSTSWTSRGWDRQREATCIRPPEVAT